MRSSHVRAECLPGKKRERGGEGEEKARAEGRGVCRQERPGEESLSAGRGMGEKKSRRGSRVDRKERGGDRARTSAAERK